MHKTGFIGFQNLSYMCLVCLTRVHMVFLPLSPLYCRWLSQKAAWEQWVATDTASNIKEGILQFRLECPGSHPVPFSLPAPKSSSWVLWGQGNSLLASHLWDFVNQTTERWTSHTSVSLMEGSPSPSLPVNLLSFRLRHKPVSQKGRALPETSTVLYSPSWSLLRVSMETLFEQAMLTWHTHSGDGGCCVPLQSPGHASCFLNS